ncbi:MAG: CoA ester lyase [Ignavibacteriaceae bacterium]|nr:CoA ester lyase [Ignavibacteriaceae bacterium]
MNTWRKLRRTILSVPANNMKMIEKSAGLSADIIMLDLEDSVPLSQKDEARATAVKAVNSGIFSGKTVSVRVNPTGTAQIYKDIIALAQECRGKIESVIIPKTDRAADIHFAEGLLRSVMAESASDELIYIEPSIESAEGLENISEIASASALNISLVFGIADFTASTGGRLTSLSGHGENDESVYPGHRFHYVMSRIVSTARANGLYPIDAPFGNFRDTEGLKKSCLTATALGFEGKWVIHPDQIETVNSVFAPSQEEIERAGAIIQAYENAGSNKAGSAQIEGRMIDGATLRLAKLVHEKAELMKNV